MTRRASRKILDALDEALRIAEPVRTDAPETPEPAPKALTPLDEMRAALVQCAFLPGHPHKRFARQVAAMPLDKITEAQRRHIIRLAWRYRRSMPARLVPRKDAVEALDGKADAG